MNKNLTDFGAIKNRIGVEMGPISLHPNQRVLHCLSFQQKVMSAFEFEAKDLDVKENSRKDDEECQNIV